MKGHESWSVAEDSESQRDRGSLVWRQPRDSTDAQIRTQADSIPLTVKLRLQYSLHLQKRYGTLNIYLCVQIPGWGSDVYPFIRHYPNCQNQYCLLKNASVVTFNGCYKRSTNNIPIATWVGMEFGVYTSCHRGTCPSLVLAYVQWRSFKKPVAAIARWVAHVRSFEKVYKY